MGLKKEENIPKVLEQRLLITPEDRKFLKIIEEMSPRDTGNIYVLGNPLNLPVPSPSMLAKALNKDEKEIIKQAEDIAKKWNLPNKNNLPTGNGIWDKDHALIHALGNQHKLRWDEKRNDYRVPRIHMFNALMSAGTLITNNDAFEGEKIVRQSLGIDEILNSYHVQDGIMPEIIEIYGKAKHKRAIMTGLNKTGKPIDSEKYEAIKKTLEMEGNKLTQKDWDGLEKFVIGTIDSREEAVGSVPHELAPMYQYIPEHVDIHWHLGSTDFENIGHIKDKHVAKRKIVNKKITEANTKLPGLREILIATKQEAGKTLINKLLSDKVYIHVNNQRNRFDDNAFPETGKEFREIRDSYFVTNGGKDAKRVQQLKKSIQSNKNYKDLFGSSSDFFDSIFDTAVIEYQELTTFSKLKAYKEKQTESLEKKTLKISSVKDKIDALVNFENANLISETQGPAWFTGHIPLLPTDAKIMEKIAKEEYKKLYTEGIIPNLKKLTGVDHKIHLHMDNLISVHVPDPEDQLKWEKMSEEEKNQTLIGTVITSFPQTNIQRGNEPIKTGFAELQGFQQNIMSSAIAKNKERPKTHGEFNKREHAFSDFYLTSHSGEGCLTQTKFAVAPTRVKGEHTYDKQLTTFFKLPTRHNYEKLYDLMSKGNTGTWFAKRAEKGGDTAGNVIVIDHPDRSQEQIFFNDDFYAKIGKKYGKKVRELESTISVLEEKVLRKGTKIYKQNSQKKLDNARMELKDIYEAARPEFYNVFNANDLHFGEWSMPGRFTLEEGIRASQQAALQAEGIDSMKAGIITEAFNGDQEFKNYVAHNLGTWSSGITFRKEINYLTQGMKNAGYSEKEILKHRDIFTQQMLDGIVTPKLEGQTNDFIFFEVPMIHELINKGMIQYLGTGNHHEATGKKRQNEADIIKKLIDADGFYEANGSIKIGYGSTSGQSFSYDMIKIPSVDGNGLEAILAHKMWSEETEVTGPIQQMVRTKDNAVYGFGADRHHEGMAAQNGKMIFIDAGKPPVNPFVQMIGKCSSVRGTQIPKYDPTGGNGYMAKRGFYDPVVEKIIGWNEKGNILERCYSIIEERMKDNAINAKLAQIDGIKNYLKK